MQIGETSLEVVRGSVTDQETDAIVNAANTAMRGGGGIDGRIHSLAGRSLMDELAKVAPNGAKTSVPVITGGHNLPQKHIIHVAGPVWHGGKRDEPQLLRAAYRNSLEAADALGLESIAFCSISTGVYGYPISEAAPLALKTAKEFVENHPGTSLRKIVYAMFGSSEHAEFERALAEMEAAC